MERRTVGMVVKPDAEAGATADELSEWLKRRNVGVVRKNNPQKSVWPDEDRSRAPEGLYCVFVLGGDGTFLSAARWLGNQPVPLLGVKFGEVGFLAEILEEHLFHAAETILYGNFSVSPRMRLQVTVWRENVPVVDEAVLNDVVLTKRSLARLARIEADIDNAYLTTFTGDGLIVATPTGSTAYSLAAGGPVVHPDVPGIVMTPICPFTLTNRPLVLPDTASVELRPDSSSPDIMLTLDGQAGIDILPGDRITLKKADSPVHMITEPRQSYFDVLKAKLRWSGGRT